MTPLVSRGGGSCRQGGARMQVPQAALGSGPPGDNTLRQGRGSFRAWALQGGAVWRERLGEGAPGKGTRMHPGVMGRGTLSVSGPQHPEWSLRTSERTLPEGGRTAGATCQWGLPGVWCRVGDGSQAVRAQQACPLLAEMVATQQQMNDAQLVLQQRDYCAHYLIRLLKCKRDSFPNFLACKHEQHDWEYCEHLE